MHAEDAASTGTIALVCRWVLRILESVGTSSLTRVERDSNFVVRDSVPIRPNYLEYVTDQNVK